MKKVPNIAKNHGLVPYFHKKTDPFFANPWPENAKKWLFLINAHPWWGNEKSDFFDHKKKTDFNDIF